MNRLSGQSRVIDTVPRKPLRHPLPLLGHVPEYRPLSDFEVPEKVKVRCKGGLCRINSFCCGHAQAGSPLIAVFLITCERVVSTAVCRRLNRSVCEASPRKATMIGYDEGARNRSRVVRECEVEASVWVVRILNATRPLTRQIECLIVNAPAGTAPTACQQTCKAQECAA